MKVLPQYLDASGRTALSPSLYERDAYQDHLRKHPDEQAGMNFQVFWKARRTPELLMKLELQGNRDNKFTSAQLLSPTINHDGGREWTSLILSKESLAELGKLISWRATLWQGTNQLAEQKSFLW